MVKNIDENNIVFSNSAPLTADQSYSDTRCLAFGNYMLAVSHDTSKTFTRNLSYALSAVEFALFEDATNAFYEAVSEFAVCKKDTDCADYDGCSIDVCNSTLRVCENNFSNCSNCDWVSVDIVPDNYPEETTWYLKNDITKQKLMQEKGIEMG